MTPLPVNAARGTTRGVRTGLTGIAGGMRVAIGGGVGAGGPTSR